MSKIIKQYLVSINDEIQDNFKSKVKAINSRSVEEVFNSPLQSSYYGALQIIKKELSDFVEDSTTVLDYYAEAIFFGGKSLIRKRLKLPIEKSSGQKYSFTILDKSFLQKYHLEGLHALAQSIVNQCVEPLLIDATNKVQDQWGIIDEDSLEFNYSSQQLNEDSSKVIIKIIDEIVSKLIVSVIEIITEEVIILFKQGQVSECKNLGIDKIRIKASNDTNCCPVCKVRSDKILDVDDIIDNFDLDRNILHAFCKTNIEPVINFHKAKSNSREDFHLSENFVGNQSNTHINPSITQKIDNLKISDLSFYNIPIEAEEAINKLSSKVKIYLSDFISPIEFYFVNDVVKTEDWFNYVKQSYLAEYDELKAHTKVNKDQDSLKGLIDVFRIENKVYISNFTLVTQSIEDVIVREILRHKDVYDKDWWQSQYEERVKGELIGNGVSVTSLPFLNYFAQESIEDFILESLVCYFNNPSFLNALDIEVYDKIKSGISKE